MTKHVFIGEKPERLDIEQLRADVASVRPGVVVTFHPGPSWNKWPYTEQNKPEWLEEPEDLDAPYNEPDVLVFENVPEDVSRQQIKRFLLEHAPEESTIEQEQRALQESESAKLLANPEFQKVLQRLEALEGG